MSRGDDEKHERTIRNRKSVNPTASASNIESKEKKKVLKPLFSVNLALFVLSFAVVIGTSGYYFGFTPQKVIQHARGLYNKSTLVDKYKSSLVHIETQQLLSFDATCTEKTVEILPEFVPVLDVMGQSDRLRAEGLVFVMLNGRNEGKYVKWTRNNGCLFELASAAAESLQVIDQEWLQQGVKLMNQYGKPVSTVDQLDQTRIVHVLLDFQIWVWPGIEIGHVYDLGRIKMKTMSLEPLVFSVENFFTHKEAAQIIDMGSAKFERSPVDGGEEKDGYSADRTSYTAFLNDDQFTRDFRHRTADLARLPSASFVERLQLVRYKVGQFFRKHEDYFDSKKFLPEAENAMEDYNLWIEWATQNLQDADPTDLPDAFLNNGKLFPKRDDSHFERQLLQVFLDEAKHTDFFFKHADQEWGDWIKENVDNNADGIMETLLEDKAYMLPHIIRAWEKHLGRKDIMFTKPSRGVSDVSRYFYWIRWAKERIQQLGNVVPAIARPGGAAYPSYTMGFQKTLLDYMFTDYSPAQLQSFFGEDWFNWINENRNGTETLLEILRNFPDSIEFVLKPWEKRAKLKAPKRPYIRHFQPNRFVTLFLYLNDVDEGGETVFPHSKERLVTEIERTGMKECSDGLAVPPVKLTASLFYAQTPDQELDPLSLHGGCPPIRGIKFGANSFAWNADADESSDAWGF